MGRRAGASWAGGDGARDRDRHQADAPAPTGGRVTMELWLLWVEDADDGERYTFGAFEEEDMAREVYEIMLEEWGADVQLTHFVAADGETGRKRGKIGQVLGKIRGQAP